MKIRSPYTGYVFMAIAVSLICNFSYLLLLVSNQTDAGNRRSTRNRNKDAVIEVVEGRLSVNGDGYGYIVSEKGDSVYIDHRKLNRLSLSDGDILRVEAAERTNFEAPSSSKMSSIAAVKSTTGIPRFNTSSRRVLMISAPE